MTQENPSTGEADKRPESNRPTTATTSPSARAAGQVSGPSAEQPPGHAFDGDAITVIAFTLFVQALATMAMLTLPAITPYMAEILNVPSALIGLQISLLYASALVTTILSGTLTGRLGGCRVSQISTMFVLAGCLVAMVPHPLALGVTSVVFGLAYGCTNPAASHLLTRFTPPGHRNLIFSIKQTGVPIGGIAAGLLAPPLATGFFWQAPLLLVAGLAVLLCVLGQLRRTSWDDDRKPGTQRLGASLLASFNPLRRQPELRWLMLCGFCLAGIQLSIMTFLVVLLVEDLGIGLIVAGSVLAATQAAGAAGRLFWGAVSDRIGNGPKILSIIMTIQLAAALATPLLSPGWPFWAVIAVFLVLGATSIGWNGVFMAEVARRSPPGQVGQSTSGAMMFTFLGVCVTPLVFSTVQRATGAYTSACLLLVVMSVVSLVAVHRLRRGSTRDA